MENGTSKFHQNTRRTERKALAAGFCTLFSKSPLRRVTALVLVTAIALGFTVTAVAQQVDPVQVTDPAEFPTITVETNLVMNEASGLPDIITDGANKYGFIEVSLRVTPGTSGLFSGAALALTYDETILTPVTWNQLDETTGKRDKYEVVNTTTSVIPFDIFLSTKKADIISTASAYVGGSDGAGKSLLYLNAESEYPTPLAGDSRLVVVRFRYDATANPLTYDATAKAIMNGANAVTFLGWASDANAALSFAGANAYFTGKNEPLVRESMYYIHKDPNPAAWTKTDADGLSMPDTACFQLVKAVKPGGTSTDADYYSYVSNFFPVDATYMASFAPPLTEPKIKFTQVTAATADQGSGGISLDDLSTILFYDWDDTLLGALTVPKGMDVREEVNTYVRENFIHPDLRANAGATLGSVDRVDTYRGKYPAQGPGVGATHPDTDPEPGSNYPLTNKLDYVFMKRVMEFTPDDVAYYITADYDADYPYTHGWAKVGLDSMEDSWTTMGVSELLDYYPDPNDGGGLFFGDADVMNAFQIEKFADVQDDILYVKAIYEPGTLLEDGSTGTTDYTTGKPSFTRYGAADSGTNGVYVARFEYERINAEARGVVRTRNPAARIEMKAYTVQINDVAASFDGDMEALWNDLASYCTDISGGAADLFLDFGAWQELGMSINIPQINTFPIEVKVNNVDEIFVEVTMTSAVTEIGYGLRDKGISDNFVTGGSQSTADIHGVWLNYRSDVSFADRLATEGFVMDGTLGMINEQGSLRYHGEKESFTSYITLATINDLGLRPTATANYSAMTLNGGRNAIYAAISEALALPSKDYVDPNTGYSTLTWHQLQYYILNSNLVSDAVAQAENYNWYNK